VALRIGGEESRRESLKNLAIVFFTRSDIGAGARFVCSSRAFGMVI
jgi:hypothetical protein